jgi:hypothetical protein
MGVYAGSTEQNDACSSPGIARLDHTACSHVSKATQEARTAPRARANQPATHAAITTIPMAWHAACLLLHCIPMQPRQLHSSPQQRHAHQPPPARPPAISTSPPLPPCLPALQVRESASKDKTQAPVIDCSKHNISKVLGKGQLPKQPVVVKAKFFSKLAEKKIKEVGGACILTA